MGTLVSWAIVIAFFLLGGYGVTLVRNAVMGRIIDPTQPFAGPMAAGLILIAVSVGFLGGLIYHREKKRGRARLPRRRREGDGAP